MRTLLLTFLILITAGMSANASTDPDNEQNGVAGQVDEQGRKQGTWIFLGRHMPKKGYPSENKIMEGDYINDRREGEWTHYFKDGNIKGKNTFVNNVNKGFFIKYSEETGKVIKKGAFDKSSGGYQGKLEMNYADGTPKARHNYNKGKEDGEQKKFHANGKPSLIYNSTNGLKTKATFYYPNGDIKREVTYGPDGKATGTKTHEMVNAEEVIKDDNAGGSKAEVPKGGNMGGKKFAPDAYNKIYNKDGEIWQDGLFKGGRLYDGKIYKYDSDGLIQKVEIYKKGRYHSDGQI